MKNPTRGVKFGSKAYSEFQWWQQNNPITAVKIERLIAAAYLNPATGIGKPEPLKHDLSGWYSRRINIQDRMVYSVTEDGYLYILSLRYHY